MTISSAAITRKHAGYMSRVYGSFAGKMIAVTVVPGTTIQPDISGSGDLAGVSSSGKNLGVSGGGVSRIIASGQNLGVTGGGVSSVTASGKNSGVSGSSSGGLSGSGRNRGVSGKGGNG